MKKIIICLLIVLFNINSAKAQENDSQLGAWYMYFWNTKLGESKWGLAGDVQYRDYKLAGDFQQLILRGGVTYTFNPNILGMLGYAHFTSGELGESKATVNENRVFEDINLPHAISERILVRHRFRYEQRWVEEQDFRTRYRYALAVTIPLLQPNLQKNSLYLAFFDEVFINGQTDIGNGQTVQFFDRNWLYGALGYAITNKFKFQLGLLRQTTNATNVNQLQVSAIQTF